MRGHNVALLMTAALPELLPLVAGSSLSYLMSILLLMLISSLVDLVIFRSPFYSSSPEDYFDSAWYFDAGEFYFPVSGFTHLNMTDGITWSAYR